MPCYRCGKIQTDPVKGASMWARIVTGGEQLLICPDCQGNDPGWKAAGDRCRSCGSSRLVIVLDSVVCKQCGAESPRKRS